ncbi:hypothetical protein Trydic_g22720 [Trypoxylus dichotomus]
MEHLNIYDDISHVDLGIEINKLEEQNKFLLNHISKLEEDIRKLCTELTNMKEIQQNLSRNISELFKTAKMEIQRKDRTIAELRQEIDDLILNRGGNFKKFKRQLYEKEDNNHPKRFASDAHVNEEKSVKDGLTKSTLMSDGNKLEVRETQDEDMHKTNRNYKTDNFNRNARYSHSGSRSKYQNKGTRYNDTRRGEDGRFRRSRSIDKYKRSSRDKYRSRSRDKYNSSASHTRWKENISSECSRSNSNRTSKSMDRRSNYEYCERSPLRHDRAFDYNKQDLSNLIKSDLNPKPHEVIHLTDDIEDGEITTESDGLVIEDSISETKHFNTKQPKLTINKSEVKPITIEEYRSRKKDVEHEAEVTDYKELEDKEIDECLESTTLNASNNKESDTQKEAEKIKSDVITDNSSNLNNNLRIANYSASVIADTDRSGAFLNSSDNTAINIRDDGNNSISSDSCNISHSENISSLSNTPNSGNRRPRKRRCVVIGLKEKV